MSVPLVITGSMSIHFPILNQVCFFVRIPAHAPCPFWLDTIARPIYNHSEASITYFTPDCTVTSSHHHHTPPPRLSASLSSRLHAHISKQRAIYYVICSSWRAVRSTQPRPKWTHYHLHPAPNLTANIKDALNYLDAVKLQFRSTDVYSASWKWCKISSNNGVLESCYVLSHSLCSTPLAFSQDWHPSVMNALPSSLKTTGTDSRSTSSFRRYYIDESEDTVLETTPTEVMVWIQHLGRAKVTGAMSWASLGEQMSHNGVSHDIGNAGMTSTMVRISDRNLNADGKSLLTPASLSV